MNSPQSPDRAPARRLDEALEHAGRPTPHKSPTSKRALILLATVVGILFLRAASAVLIPVVVGVAFVTLLWPVQVRLTRKLSLVAAYLSCLLLLLATVALGASLVWRSFDVLNDQAPRFAERLAELREAVREIVPSALPTRDAGVPSGVEGSLDAQSANLVSGTLRMLASGSTMLGLAIAFFALGLWEVSDFQRRLREDLGAAGARTYSLLASMAHEFRRFVVIKSVTSAITGICTGIATWLLGVDHPWVWGLAAFALEYLPTIGSFIAVFPPVLYALVQFDGFLRPAIVLLTIGALQLVLGNYVDPKIEGRFLAMSPAVVLLAIVFWGWVWGVAGALLGVPMTLAIIIAAREFPSTRWIAVMLADDRRRGESGHASGDACPDE